MKKTGYEFNHFPAGLAAGTILTISFFWVLDASVGSVVQENLVQFCTIGATLLAAGVAYGGILHQIKHQALIAETIRIGELEAERAVLPLALSRVCEISIRGMQDIVGHAKVADPLARVDMVLETTHIESIKATIRVSNAEVSARLQAILRGYQVALASVDWEDLTQPLSVAPNEQNPDSYTRISLCYRWALLYSLAESLFDFARGGELDLTEAFPNVRMFSAARFAGIHPPQYTDFEGFFKRAIERDRMRTIPTFFLRQ
ncbi:hypothetical protein SAMN05421665_2954 [Yoonia rosea]|uniref:Uncharacterized protein n=1 Tax=Yoonia rosea TaxID=287098 RepID=A0A1R3XGL9_9RHOB|nr:hypothetical protein [Yoonia rosea]SIT90015.1 hypothetical protein SAMN05421665_2954 [Yoonia rosea]